jgi:hypothetical protein
MLCALNCLLSEVTSCVLRQLTDNRLLLHLLRLGSTVQLQQHDPLRAFRGLVLGVANDRWFFQLHCISFRRRGRLASVAVRLLTGGSVWQTLGFVARGHYPRGPIGGFTFCFNFLIALLVLIRDG